MCVKGVRSVNFKITVWNSECNISSLKNVSLILVLVVVQACIMKEEKESFVLTKVLSLFRLVTFAETDYLIW
jgi:hypothetical protein